ncbi:MAG: type II/IV secretion system ATPase subunit [Desulfurococcaceae archaeon]
MALLEERIKLGLLEPPVEKVECIDEYSVGPPGRAFYVVCISRGRYLVYDAIAGDPSARRELKKLEKRLYDVLVGEESITDLLDRVKDERLRHVVERQFLGYGVLEPFFLDPNVINVHIMVNKPLQVMHRVHGRLSTNVVLSAEEVKEYAMRLAAAAGKPLSEAMPLFSFIEPRYESRVTVVYLSDVTMRRDMTIDIRKVVEKPWTILKLLHFGSLSFEEAAFLWLMVKYKVPVVIVGELMSGKTTLAAALLALIPPGSRVFTVEDAPEIRIPSDYWTRTTVREYGEYPVRVFDLLKTSVRLSVDYIVVGEIRGEEAREWAHAVLLGHGTVTTFHAESPEAAILRLISPPISVDPQVLRLLNVFVKTNVFERAPGVRSFRHEVYVYEENVVKPLFVYDPARDKVVPAGGAGNPIRELKFIDRIVLAHRVPREALEREYAAMVEVLREAYEEAASRDPTLETPTYRELPAILYGRLYEKLKGTVA